MANNILTVNQITREAVRIWKNFNSFIQNVNTQYDDQYARSGAKIGTALRIRLPNDFTPRTGAAAAVQDVNEQNTQMALATQKGVDMSFSSVDMTMSIQDFSERFLAPAVNVLTGAVAVDIMSGAEGGVCNYVDNESGGVIITPTQNTVLSAGAVLDTNSALALNRRLVTDPFTDARVVSALSGLFNPSQAISQQYTSGAMKNALGFDWMKDQTVIQHTTGTFTAGTVSGANQTGTTITTSAITGTLNKGDIITIAGVDAVNRITKQDTGALRQFVVTANVASGATSIPIYPALIPSNAGAAVQYQTVTVSPANSATISLVSPAGGKYRKNIAFVPDAVTMATADLIAPPNVDCARAELNGVSMRMVRQYVVATDQLVSRLDVLYGYLWIRPEWCCVVADAI